MIPRKYLKLISITILLIGLGGAVFLYLTAGPPDVENFNPLASKKYIRELELYGGKFNVLAVELNQWFADLWHGKSLAVIVGITTLALASLLWFISSFPSMSHDTEAPDTNDDRN